ncbi:bacteriohemerythrin [Gorillibacterium sp. sgz5001074]|uniref:bacteriohemerythrin n=1 Tax=Gorillibacterium sp. sgz5001074 TaxID=3446695 RepID=UPI003F66174D
MSHWNTEYNIGVEHIDRQHEQLVLDLAAFKELCDRDARQDAITVSLRGLAASIQEHFASEEALMAEIGYPELPKHKKAHDSFLGTLSELENNIYVHGLHSSTYPKIIQLLSDWLVNHICHSDSKIGEFVRAR